MSYVFIDGQILTQMKNDCAVSQFYKAEQKIRFYALHNQFSLEKVFANLYLNWSINWQSVSRTDH